MIPSEAEIAQAVASEMKNPAIEPMVRIIVKHVLNAVKKADVLPTGSNGALLQAGPYPVAGKGALA